MIALIGVAGLGVATKGHAVDQVVVKIPYEFVVAGKTLPAVEESKKMPKQDIHLTYR